MISEVERVFETLADLDPEAREAYFAAHPVDTEVRREVESLLAHDRSSADSLADPIRKLAASAMESTAGGGDRRCGPYQLTEILGRGGMGTVYRAKRVDGELRQEVAVKLMQGAGDDGVQRQRFLQERQILAELAHANIAGLLDAGHSAEGQPYFVMELVEGQPIDQFCEGLSARQKVEIFLEVCEAVSFAHSRLVVHRDIKPGNILVTAEGTPKLLDFGIAKMLGFDAGVTQAWQCVMTPAYGSPEQAAGGAVTTASDIYSLGAVLYKILTGHAPHEPAQATPEAMLAAVREGNVPRASRWNGELKGDLDAIVAKALRTEPAQRYATVEQLSSDLRCYLERRPIRARQGEYLYRTGKFVRRAWIPLTAVLLVMAALTIGLVDALRARQLAERRFRIARDIAGSLFGIEERVRNLPGSTESRRYIADKSLAYLNELSKEASERDLLLELAEAYKRTANVLSRRGGSSLGRDADAFAALDRGNALLLKAAAARPQDRAVVRAMIENRMDYLTLLSDKSKRPQVGGLVPQIAVLVSRFTASGLETRDLPLVVQAYVGLRRAMTANDRNGAARPYAELSVRYSRQYAEALGTPDARVQYAAALRNYGSFLRYAGELEQAAPVLNEALGELERVPRSKRQQVELSAVLYYIGLVNSDSESLGLDRPAVAIPALERSAATSRELMAADPKDHNARVDFAQSELRLASLMTPERPASAAPLFDGVLEVMRAEPEGSFLRDEYLIRAAAESTYALRKMGRTAEARRRLAEIRGTFFRERSPENAILTGTSPAEAVLRAEADMDAAGGDMQKGVATYLLLLRKFQAYCRPDDSIVDAMALSIKLGRLSQLYVQSGDIATARDYAAQRAAVWQHWNAKLPNHLFIIRQLLAAQNN